MESKKVSVEKRKKVPVVMGIYDGVVDNPYFHPNKQTKNSIK